MNTVAEAALLTLLLINGVVGVLLLLGKVRLVRTRPQSSTPAAPSVTEVVVPDVTTGKRGRPRKGEKRRYTRHLWLQASVTHEQLADTTELFHNHQDEFGDRIVLHVPTPGGPERELEIPYLVLWSEQVKDRLSTILGGWA